MNIIGFNFSKVSVEKMKRSVDKLNINAEIDISDIKALDSGIINTEEDVLEAKFKYHVNYDPGFAKVELEGHILFTLEPQLAKEVLTQWKKKQIPEEVRLILINVVMKKGGPRAVILEDELNIPLHIPFPSIKKDANQKK